MLRNLSLECSVVTELIAQAFKGLDRADGTLMLEGCAPKLLTAYQWTTACGLAAPCPAWHRRAFHLPSRPLPKHRDALVPRRFSSNPPAPIVPQAPPTNSTYFLALRLG